MDLPKYVVVVPTKISKPPAEEPEVDPRLTPSEKEWLKAAREEEAQDKEKEKESAESAAKGLQSEGGGEGEGQGVGAEAGAVDAAAEKDGPGKAGAGAGAGAADGAGGAASAEISSGKAKGKLIQGTPTTTTTTTTTGGGGTEGVAGAAAEASVIRAGAVVTAVEAGVAEKDEKVMEAGEKEGKVPPVATWSHRELTEFDAKRDALELKVNCWWCLLGSEGQGGRGNDLHCVACAELLSMANGDMAA